MVQEVQSEGAAGDREGEEEVKTLSIHLRLPEATVTRVDRLAKTYSDLGTVSRAQVLRGLIATGLAWAEGGQDPAKSASPSVLSSAKKGGEKE